MEKLGKKISRLRESKGLTQEELSFKAKVARRTLQNIEGGKVMSPGIDVISALAKQLDTTVSDIIGEKSKNDEPKISKSDLILSIQDQLKNLNMKQLEHVKDVIEELKSGNDIFDMESNSKDKTK